LLHKGQQHRVQFFRPHLRGKPVQAGRHHFGVELLAVARHQHVAGLVDKAHGIKLAGMNRPFGMGLGVAHLVHAVGELAARGHIGENHVARIGEESPGELVAFPRLPRNVEFHHRYRSSAVRSSAVLGPPKPVTASAS
jgi:hypothetical protein